MRYLTLPAIVLVPTTKPKHSIRPPTSSNTWKSSTRWKVSAAGRSTVTANRIGGYERHSPTVFSGLSPSFSPVVPNSPKNSDFVCRRL